MESGKEVRLRFERTFRNNKKKMSLLSGTVVVAGDQGVGKSSLVKRLADNVFDTFVAETIGVDLVVRRIESTSSHRPVKLKVWDTAGQERFMAICQTYFRQASLVLLCYDATDMESLRHLKSRWWPLVASQCDPSRLLVFLVGTKCDLPSTSMAKEMEGVVRSWWMAREGDGMWATHVRPKAIYHMSTSSKLGSNVQEVFQFAADSLEAHDLLVEGRDEFAHLKTLQADQNKWSCCTLM